MMTEVAERAARDLFEHGTARLKARGVVGLFRWEELPAHEQDIWREDVAAVVKSIREPTAEMLAAGRAISTFSLDAAWRAMIDAILVIAE